MHPLTYQIARSSPFLLLALWAVTASAVLWWKGSGSRRPLLWLVVPVVLLALLSTPLAAYLALGSLEWSHPPRDQRPEPCPAIVILTGGMSPPDDVRRQAEPTADTIYRCLHGAALYHQGEPCPILVSGGKVLADQPGPTLAEVARDLLLKLGVAAEHIWLESISRTTYENAVECREQLAARGIDRIVLVTSAAHMPRAERCFRCQGLTVIPSACQHRATILSLRPGQFLPSPSGAADMQDAYHEWAGLLWYRLRGRI